MLNKQSINQLIRRIHLTVVVKCANSKWRRKMSMQDWGGGSVNMKVLEKLQVSGGATIVIFQSWGGRPLPPPHPTPGPVSDAYANSFHQQLVNILFVHYLETQSADLWPSIACHDTWRHYIRGVSTVCHVCFLLAFPRYWNADFPSEIVANCYVDE